MQLASLRNALIVGTLFARRGRAATRLLAGLVGFAAALAVCGLFGLASFVSLVGDRGQLRDFGSYREGGCIQAQYRYDPVRLEQYVNHLVAATCDDPRVPPGLPRFPRVGEVYVSPALAALRAQDQGFATRFPRVDGLIGPAGLTGADELFSIVGVEPVTGDLPLGVTSFDQFGGEADYLSTFLRFDRGTFFGIGLFFTLLPAGYLVAACTRLNARTRQRQLGLLSVMGVDPTVMRRALVWEATLTVGAGAVVGSVVASSLLSRVTPTFVSWRAFPGDLSPPPAAPVAALVLILVMTGGAAALGARPVTQRRGEPSPVARTRSFPWRWGILALGGAAALIVIWWNSDAAWPLILTGRVSSFVGLAVIAPPVCAYLGRRFSKSEKPTTSLVGVRLRHPSGSLTRALGALASGLFILSAGTTTAEHLGEDPATLQQFYEADGITLVEVRRPSQQLRSMLTEYNILSGSSAAARLYGSCAALQQAIGNPIDCGEPGSDEISLEGQSTSAPRAEALSGFVVNIVEQGKIQPGDDYVFIPLPSAEAIALYDRLIGSDPAANVRFAGAAVVSGASELAGILDVFRWGAAFAVIISLLAVLVSLVALLYDRHAGNNHMQIIGVTRRQVALVMLTEVAAAFSADLA